jgi:hypothetical protein
MQKSPTAQKACLGAAFLAVFLTAAPVLAQAPNPPAPAAPASDAAVPAPQILPATAVNDALLAKAAKLYYSSDKTGLARFDCAVHADWHAVFLDAGNGAPVADDDPRVLLLNSVKVTLHARMKGGSGIDWVPPAHPAKPLDQDSIDLLDKMQAGTAQMLQGFMQFWPPFVDGSVVPDSSEGLEVTSTDKGGYKMHAEGGGTSLTEVFSNDMVLEQFNVAMGGMTIDFSPAYKPTEKGLLVQSFQARILPAGTPPEQAQLMHVALEYHTVDGFPIPARLNMEVVGTGKFNFLLDGCRVNPPAE